jgi:hypothetical protein
MKADKLASFRIDNELWKQFQGIAATNSTTASALLVGYIESVVNTGNVNTPAIDAVNTTTEKKPSLSIQDIDKRIDDKIKTAIQDVNTISIQNIEDLADARIAGSIADGDIGGAIAKCYRDMMGQFNEVLSRFEELKDSIPPAAAVPSSQSPVTNHQLPKTTEEVIGFLAIEDILGGDPYWQEQLEIKGIDAKIKDNFEHFQSLGIDFKGVRDGAVSRFNRVLKWLGYKGDKQKTTVKQSTGGVNLYLAMKVSQ